MGRYQGHLETKSHNKHLDNWICLLLSQGLFPIITILEKCPYEIWQEREKFWIAKLRTEGCNLINITDGGEGGITSGSFKPGYKPTAAQLEASFKPGHKYRFKPGHKYRFKPGHKYRFKLGNKYGFKPGYKHAPGCCRRAALIRHHGLEEAERIIEREGALPK